MDLFEHIPTHEILSVDFRIHGNVVPSSNSGAVKYDEVEGVVSDSNEKYSSGHRMQIRALSGLQPGYDERSHTERNKRYERKRNKYAQHKSFTVGQKVVHSYLRRYF